jgi:hypothetical protein
MALQKITNKMYRFSDYILEGGSSISSMGVGKEDEENPSMIWTQSSSANFGQPAAVDDPPGGDDFDPNAVDFEDPETWPRNPEQFDEWFEIWWEMYGNGATWGMMQQWRNISSRNTISMLGGQSMQSFIDSQWELWRSTWRYYFAGPQPEPLP